MRLYKVDTLPVDVHLGRWTREALMKATVRKWGNSASVRIPAAIMEAARLRLDQPVEIREEQGRVVIEPIRLAEHDLAELVAAITEENRHDPVETAAPVGKEVW